MSAPPKGRQEAVTPIVLGRNLESGVDVRFTGQLRVQPPRRATSSLKEICPTLLNVVFGLSRPLSPSHSSPQNCGKADEALTSTVRYDRNVRLQPGHGSLSSALPLSLPTSPL